MSAPRCERPPIFPAILGLSVVVHVAVVSFVPEPASPPATTTLASSEIVLEAPPPPPAAEPPPPPPEPQPPPPLPAPRAPAREPPPRAPIAAAPPRPTVLEESTAASDVKIDAEVGTSASTPATAAPPPHSAPTAPVAVPRPAPTGPPIVPSRSLGKLPRAPALDGELARNYPADARRAGIAGTSRLRLQVLPDGRLGRVDHLSETHPGFAHACERTVRAARWEPPRDREGRAVATEIKYVCRFELRR